MTERDLIHDGWRLWDILEYRHIWANGKPVVWFTKRCAPIAVSRSMLDAAYHFNRAARAPGRVAKQTQAQRVPLARGVLP